MATVKESILVKILKNGPNFIAILGFIGFIVWQSWADPKVKATAKKEVQDQLKPIKELVDKHAKEIKEIRKAQIETNSYLYVLSTPEQRKKAKELADYFKKKSE